MLCLMMQYLLVWGLSHTIHDRYQCVEGIIEISYEDKSDCVAWGTHTSLKSPINHVSWITNMDQIKETPFWDRMAQQSKFKFLRSTSVWQSEELYRWRPILESDYLMHPPPLDAFLGTFTMPTKKLICRVAIYSSILNAKFASILLSLYPPKDRDEVLQAH